MRRRILILTGVCLALVGLTFGGLAAYTWWQLATIETFETASTPVPVPTGTSDAVPMPDGIGVFLVFSVGSEGIEESDGDRLGIGRGRARMADGLTDSVMVVVTNPVSRSVGVVSIPRDTWLPARSHRINESYKRYGIDGFIADVSDLTGLPVDHAISVNFAAFADLTDAVGGVDVELPVPVRDLKAKLDLPAGCVHLDGSSALAFVRSRHWQVYTNGSWRADATSSDWGRIERQQAFLRLVLARILTPELPFRIPALVGVAGDNLVVDEDLTVSTMLGWAKAFATGVSDVAAATLPGRGFTTDAGASVIGVDPYAARETVTRVLSRIGVAVEASSGSAVVAPPDPQIPTASASPTSTGRGPETPTTTTPPTTPSTTGTTPQAVSPPPASATIPAAKPSPWRPDTGDGAGGLRFTGCS